MAGRFFERKAGHPLIPRFPDIDAAFFMRAEVSFFFLSVNPPGVSDRAHSIDQTAAVTSSLRRSPRSVTEGGEDEERMGGGEEAAESAAASNANDKGKLFYVIQCENSTAWSPVSFSDMFTKLLKREGDVWRTVLLANGEPLPSDIRSAAGIVLTGSRFNCRDRETLEWFDPLCDLIRYAAETGGPRVYGGCFGCQIVAFALGGEVDYNPEGNFLLRAESVKFLSCNCGCGSLPCMPADMECKCFCDGLRLLVSHGDCVRKLPPQAKLLAKSNSCEVEVFLAGSRDNILACQSHPEFDFQYAIEERIWKSVVETWQRLSSEEIQFSRKSFENYDGRDASTFIRWVSDFLHL